MTPAPEVLDTVQEFAARVRVAPRTVYRWLRAGNLRGATKLGGGTWRIDPAVAMSPASTDGSECPNVSNATR